MNEIYKLKSKPERAINVPEQYHTLAMNFVEDISSNREMNLFKEYPFLNNDSKTLGKAMNLQQYKHSNPERLPIAKDQLYISALLYELKKDNVEDLQTGLVLLMDELDKDLDKLIFSK